MITPLQLVSPTQVSSAYGSTSSVATGATDFASMVGNAASDALRTVHQAEATTAAGVSGRTDVQSVVMALSNAEVTMQTVVAVRDKILTAYNDVMHMGI